MRGRTVRPPHGRDPGQSVVDANLRAHDVPYLYLVGGGCFVTGSAWPPTLTITALAIRTAEHIVEVYRGHGRADGRIGRALQRPRISTASD